MPMETKERKRKRRTSSKSDAQLTYTQPKVFNRNRFLLRLATVLAIVLALVFAMSIFFRVETVNVSGVNKYTEYEVFEASGIREGEYILTLSKSRISNQIMYKLPYVKKVQIGRSLPGTVNIWVEEVDITYAAEAQDGSWWLMDSRGKILESIHAGQVAGHTKLLGFTLAVPQIGEQAVAFEQPMEETLPDGQTVPVTVTAAEHLQAMISLLQTMEQNGILGQAVSVDVSKLSDMEIWYGNQYQIQLGDGQNLEYKLKLIRGAIDQMGDYRSGMLDVSFYIRPDEVIYTPFE